LPSAAPAEQAAGKAHGECCRSPLVNTTPSQTPAQPMG
jgi:hypothetical protein